MYLTEVVPYCVCNLSFSTHIQEHMNYYCTGSSIGNLIMSLKHEEAEGQEYLRIMLRYNERNILQFGVFHVSNLLDESYH